MLNKGTVCNEEQLVNILFIVATLLVLNSGTVCSEEQPENILLILVTALVSNATIFFNLLQLKNKNTISTIADFIILI